MKLLNALPYFPKPTTVTVREETVRVRPYQIIVWISISVWDVPEWDPGTPQLPVILGKWQTLFAS